MNLMELTSASGHTTTVEVVRETAKAILVKGNMSEAWFPKAAIKDGQVQAWFQFTLLHVFLWECPRKVQ